MKLPQLNPMVTVERIRILKDKLFYPLFYLSIGANVCRSLLVVGFFRRTKVRLSEQKPKDL